MTEYKKLTDEELIRRLRMGENGNYRLSDGKI